MAGTAAILHEERFSPYQERNHRRSGRDRLPSVPSLELVRWQRDHVEGLQSVLRTAILGALSLIDAGALSGKAGDVHAPGDHVELASKTGHPKGVDYILGLEDELYRPARRHLDFVCADEP